MHSHHGELCRSVLHSLSMKTAHFTGQRSGKPSAPTVARGSSHSCTSCTFSAEHRLPAAPIMRVQCSRQDYTLTTTSKTGAIREQLGSAQMCNQIPSQPIHINTAYKNMLKDHGSPPLPVLQLGGLAMKRTC